MSEPKFLILNEGMIRRTIALDNIASATPEGMCTRIVLKEMKDGNNVNFLASESYQNVEAAISRLSNS